MRGDGGGGCFPTGRHYPGIAHLLRVTAAGLVAELSPDDALLDLTLACIDTETTGRSAADDRVVEVGVVRWRAGAVVERKGWLVNPGRPIPKEAFDVHGISDEAVADAPSFGTILPELWALLEGAVPIAYNAEFDRGFLHAEFGRADTSGLEAPPAARADVDWVDPLVWARELQRTEKSKALGEVCARLGITLDNAHRATDDAVAALEVLLAFSKDPRVPRGYGAFMQEQRRLARVQEDARRTWRGRG